MYLYCTSKKPRAPNQHFHHFHLIESLIFVFRNKNLKTPQLWIHFPIVPRDEVILDGPEQILPSGQESWVPAGHPRSQRVTGTEVWESTALRSWVADFVSEGCGRRGHTK